jgi:hypothetical protein
MMNTYVGDKILHEKVLKLYEKIKIVRSKLEQYIIPDIAKLIINITFNVISECDLDILKKEEYKKGVLVQSNYNCYQPKFNPSGEPYGVLINYYLISDANKFIQLLRTIYFSYGKKMIISYFDL